MFCVKYYNILDLMMKYGWNCNVDVAKLSTFVPKLIIHMEVYNIY